MDNNPKVYFYRPGVRLPKTGTYYIVANNGTFLRKDNGLIVAAAQVDGIGFLKEFEPWARHSFPLLPAFDFFQTILFFRDVTRHYHSEAIMLLHLYPEMSQYKFYCPPQTVGGAHLDYISTDRFENYLNVGDVHSHNNFGASHSPTDDGDEKDSDGLHITVGDLDRPFFTISCSLKVNATRFMLQPEDIIEGIQRVKWQPPPVKIYRPKYWGFGRFWNRYDRLPLYSPPFSQKASKASGFVDTYHVQYYNIRCPQKRVDYPATWMQQVTQAPKTTTTHLSDEDWGDYND